MDTYIVNSDRSAAMRPQEYEVLRQVIRDAAPKWTLEIGMARGGSTVEICRVLRDVGGEGHVAIDPYQSAPDVWNGQGIQRVRDAGLIDLVEVVEDFDYLALPRLVEQERRFDFILVDGWHSFDYTLLDLFYADLLLNRGGVMAVHDTGWPAVYRACRFLETHKPYDRLSPPLSVQIKPLAGRVLRRIGQALGGPRAMADARRRRCQWYSLAAYRKREDHQVPSNAYERF